MFKKEKIKLKIKTTTTALDVLTIMTKKISLMQAELAFDPKSKILKVKSMNDYIIEINNELYISNETYVINLNTEDKNDLTQNVQHMS